MLVGERVRERAEAHPRGAPLLGCEVGPQPAPDQGHADRRDAQQLHPHPPQEGLHDDELHEVGALRREGGRQEVDGARGRVEDVLELLNDTAGDGRDEEGLDDGEGSKLGVQALADGRPREVALEARDGSKERGDAGDDRHEQQGRELRQDRP